LGVQLFKIYLIPVKFLLKILDTLGPQFIKFALTYHLLNKLLPITTMLEWAYFMATVKVNKAKTANIALEMQSTMVKGTYINALIATNIWERLTNTVREKGIMLLIWENTLGKLAIFQRVSLNKVIVANSAARGVEVTMLQAGGRAYLMSNAEKAKEIALYIVGTPRRWASTISRAWENLAIWDSVKALGAKFLATLKEIWGYITAGGAQAARTAGRLMDTIATNWQTFSQNMNTASNGKAVLMMIFTLPYLAMKTLAYLILAAATWAVTIPTMALTGTLLVLLGPFILVGVAIGIFVGLLYVAAVRINEQIDVMFYLKQAVMGLIGIFVYFGKLIAEPFIKLGEMIYSLLEGPLFSLIQFFSHIVKMIKWVVGEIVELFKGDSVGSTLSDVLMAPFNAAKEVIVWLVGVLWSNEDSLYNKMVALAKWFDESFGITDKFNALKDAAKMAWDYIKDNMTWSSISGAFTAIGDGMKNLLLAPIRLFAAVWDGAIGIISGKSVSFGGSYGIPKITLSVPNMDSWLIGPSLKKLIGGGTAAAGADLVGSASPTESSLTSKDFEDYNPQGRAEGGYIRAMQAGGYLVGEKGPELFMPHTGGKIIPNKDLNTQRVKSMLAEAFDTAPRTGAAANINRVMSLQVENLVAGSANMKRTRMGVDTFA